MKRTQPESRRVNYCFTYNNYTPDGEENLKTWLAENTKYSVFGHEVAPTTGTPHLQGFFSLKTKSGMTTSALQKKFKKINISLTLIHAKGNADQNLAYCTKADPTGFFEHGDIKKSGQGKRSDLQDVADYIKEAPRTTLEIAENFPTAFIKFNRGLIEYKNILETKNLEEDRDVTVSIFYGEGRTGKTNYAITLCQKYNISYYMVQAPESGGTWWNMYDGERAIILDDFYGWTKPHELYRICDRYKYRIPYKGGFYNAKWKFVFITSNLPPSKFYKEEVYAKLDKTAYYGRFHNIYYWEYYDEEKTALSPLTIEKNDRPIKEKMSQTSGIYCNYHRI